MFWPSQSTPSAFSTTSSCTPGTTLAPCDSGRGLLSHSWSTEVSSLTHHAHGIMGPNQVLTMVLSQIQIFAIFGREMIRCQTWNLERLIVARPQYGQIQQASPTWPGEKNSEKRSDSDNFMKDPSLKLFWTPLSVRMWRMLSRFRHPRHSRKVESIAPRFSR